MLSESLWGHKIRMSPGCLLELLSLSQMANLLMFKWFYSLFSSFGINIHNKMNRIVFSGRLCHTVHPHLGWMQITTLFYTALAWMTFPHGSDLFVHEEISQIFFSFCFKWDVFFTIKYCNASFDMGGNAIEICGPFLFQITIVHKNMMNALVQLLSFDYRWMESLALKTNGFNEEGPEMAKRAVKCYYCRGS